MFCATAHTGARHGVPIGRTLSSGHKHRKQIWSTYYEGTLNSVELIPTFSLKNYFCQNGGNLNKM